MDIVGRYIELRKQKSEIEEQLAALETLILQNHRDDERIKIYAGRKTITIKEETYKLLQQLGYSVTVIEERFKKLQEFDAETQKLILSNPDNVEIKVAKESIRVNTNKI